MENFIKLRKVNKVHEPSELFTGMHHLYHEMGMNDNILSHSPMRIFEYPWAVDMIKPHADMRILDAGCGASPLPVYLHTRMGVKDVTGIDAQSSFDNPTFSFKPEWANQFGVNYVRANILDYRSKVYDCVLCISVLEHLYRPIDRIKAIINLWENVRDGGRLVLTFDYMVNIGIGLQYLLAPVGTTIDCVNYEDQVTAICIEKTAKEGQAEWIQLNQGL